MSDKEFKFGGRCIGKGMALREIAEKALDEGKTVVVFGKNGEPIIDLNWWKKKP